MKSILLVLLFTSLLALGCLGAQANVQANAQTGGATPTAAGGAQASAGVQAGAQVGAQAGGELPTTVKAALALGLPYYCRATVTDRETGKTQTGEMWIKGQNFRWEAVAQEEKLKGEKLISIKRGEEFFVWIPDQKIWLKLPTSAQATPQAGAAPSLGSGGSSESIEAATDLQCSPGTFGEERFATPGTVKTFQEYIESLLGGSMPRG